jgi:predicted Zn-dependent protease
MIEVTCSACGTVNRIAEGDVPPGAKFVTCTSCKSRVAVSGKAAAPPTPKAPPPVPGSIPKTPPLPTVKREPAGVTDLPAPKRTNPLSGIEKPAARPQVTGLDAELPVPKVTKSAGSGAIPLDLDELMPAADLPAPKSVGLADLPAPKARKGETGPVPKSALADLPAPKAKKPPKVDEDILDLPAPKDVADLPAPKSFTDLPAPKRPNDIIDLPSPKSASNLPKPGASTDLPAPAGFFDDLPQPAKQKGVADLPAPAGFFDDLPQPANPTKPDLPAPAGFFDDLPQPANPAKPDLPAPKGFFDDLPKPAKQKGVFDDLPMPEMPAEHAAAAKSIGDLSSADLFTPPQGNELELGKSLSGDKPLELANSAGTMDLEPGGFKDLELAEPVKPEPKPEGPIRFKKPTGGPSTPIKPAPLPTTAPKKDAPLELALEDEPHKQAKAQSKASAKRAKAEDRSAADVAKKKQQRTLASGVLVGALLLAGGGYGYKRYAAKKRVEDEIKAQLSTARASLEAATPDHWKKTAAAANAVVQLDAHNAPGYGLAAEALIAGALDTGVNGPQRIQQGRNLIARAQEASVTGAELERAQAVAAIAANQADRAVGKLTSLVATKPKDAFLQLYLGWAQLAKGDAPAALKAFEAAEASPATKQSALYGHGRAKLVLADLDAAKADFSAILEADRDHVPAQVGLAAARPPAEASQREADLLAVLARKDIKDADPRAVVLAWTLAADVARQAGRLDVARERYANAIAITATDVPALTGLALVELRDGKTAVANDLIAKALAANGDDVDAQLVAAEIASKDGRGPDANALIKKLEAHSPPLPPLQQAHLMLVKGRYLEALGQDEDAIDAFNQGAKLAGDLDLSPTMAEVEKLSEMSKNASDAAKAEAYRARADQLLSSFVQRAQDDPQLAMTLGAAYLQAGDAAKAENLLRRAVEMRGNDIEAKVQFGKALAKLGKTDEAAEQLKAARSLDPTRSDIDLELARTFEAAGRVKDATEAYNKLLANKDAPLLPRVYAGKFFARQGDLAKATAQADPILALDADNAAGHYLKGEGLLAAGKLDDARTELTRASSTEQDVQYLDALGRADEASLAVTKDPKFQEQAIHDYTNAADRDPTWFNPWAGLSRAHVARHEFTKAVEELSHAWKIKEDPEIAYNFGLAYATLGPKPTAIGWLETSARLDSKRADTWYQLGVLYQDSNRRGDDHRMIDALEKATRLGLEDEAKGNTPPDWLTEAFYTLGDQYMLVHNESGAKRAWMKYVDRKPRDQAHLSQATTALNTTLSSVR